MIVKLSWPHGNLGAEKTFHFDLFAWLSWMLEIVRQQYFY